MKDLYLLVHSGRFQGSMIKSCMKEKKERGFEDELLGLNIDLE